MNQWKEKESYSPLDPREDTESANRQRLGEAGKEGYSPLDPREDTERRTGPCFCFGRVPVTAHSIRERILKVIQV